MDLVPLMLNSDSNATLQISLDSETIVKVHEWRRDRKFLPKSMGELVLAELPFYCFASGEF